MMPLNHILRKCTARYKLSKWQEKINRLMYMEDVKLFAKNEKEVETICCGPVKVLKKDTNSGLRETSILNESINIA